MWKVEISKQSDKFLEKNSDEVRNNVFSKIRNLIESEQEKSELSFG